MDYNSLHPLQKKTLPQGSQRFRKVRKQKLSLSVLCENHCGLCGLKVSILCIPCRKKHYRKVRKDSARFANKNYHLAFFAKTIAAFAV
jgi:hypothetical protein